MWEKVRKPPNVRNELSHVMVKLQNVKIEPSSVRKTVTCDVGIVKCEKKKSKGTTKWDKRTVICDIRTTQYEDETIKCEEKSKRVTKCEKRTVICNVGTV